MAKVSLRESFKTPLKINNRGSEQDVPHITGFIKTKQWLTLSKAAKLALSEIAATIII